MSELLDALRDDSVVQRRVLDNGLTVLVEENRAAPVVAVQVWVAAGSADEDDDTRGLAHVHEHMLFKGTRRRGVGEISFEIEAVGGNINAFTSYDHTAYTVVLGRQHLGVALDVLADAVFESVFEESELRRELAVIDDEILRACDQPLQVVQQEMFATIFSRHPYRHPILGYRDRVVKYRREDVLRFFERHYTPGRMAVVIAGDVDASEAFAAVAEAFGKASRKSGERGARPDEPAPRPGQSITVHRDVALAHMAIGWRVPGAMHDDTGALDCLSAALGESDAGLLRHELQHRDRLVYDIGTLCYTPRSGGVFLVMATVEHGQEALARQRILDHFERIATSGIDDHALERARKKIIVDQLFRKETMQGRAFLRGYFTTMTGDEHHEQRYLKQLCATTAADIARVAGQYSSPELANTVVLRQ